MAGADRDRWVPLGGPRGAQADDDDTETGGPGRFGYLRALVFVAVAVALLALGVSLVLGARHRQREALHLLAERFTTARPGIEVGIEEQAVRDGAVATRVSVAELDAAGRPGARREYWVAGEELVVGAARARVVPAVDPDSPLDVLFLHHVAGSGDGGEAQSLLPDAGAPAYVAYRGEGEERVGKVEGALWDAVRSRDLGVPVPRGFQVEVAPGDEARIPLVLGERWSVEADPQGRVAPTRSRAASAAGAFDLHAPFLTRSSLEISLARVDRHVAFAGRIDGEHVFYRVTLRARNRSPQALRIDTSALQLVDASGAASRAESAQPLALAAGDGGTSVVDFRVAPGARGLRLVVPGEELGSQERGRPVALPLGPAEPGLGDVVAVPGLLVAVLDAERAVEGAHFVYRVDLEVLNVGAEPAALGAGQFVLDDLRWERAAPVAPSDLQPTDLLPLTPRRVVARFPAGSSVFRGDPALLVRAAGDDGGPPARVRLSPRDLGATGPSAEADLAAREVRAQQASTHLAQVAAARHWTAARGLLSKNRGLMGWLGDGDRSAEAQAHLAEARRLFPDSGIFGEPAETPESP